MRTHLLLCTSYLNFPKVFGILNERVFLEFPESAVPSKGCFWNFELEGYVDVTSKVSRNEKQRERYVRETS